MEILKDSGCVNLRIGFESANETMRNEIYVKDVPQESLIKSVELCKRNNISIMGYFLAGGPGERLSWLVESLRFAANTGIEYPVFFLYKPIAGTKILMDAERLGSTINHESLNKPASFLAGVNMKHKNISTLQLKVFPFISHIAFGPRIFFSLMRRSGFLFFIEMARYMHEALSNSVSAYDAFSAYILYGNDHRQRPYFIKEGFKPGFLLRFYIQSVPLLVKLLAPFRKTL